MNESFEDFELEIRKFEARFERFLDREKDLAESLNACVRELKDVCNELAKIRSEAVGREQKTAELRLRVLKALNEVFLKESEVEHERSHLLESFGSFLIALEDALKLEQ